MSQLLRDRYCASCAHAIFRGFDVYLLAYAKYRNAGYILLDLDQATADVLPLMRAHGHEPCVVLQTSPGHRRA